MISTFYQLSSDNGQSSIVFNTDSELFQEGKAYVKRHAVAKWKVREKVKTSLELGFDGKCIHCKKPPVEHVFGHYTPFGNVVYCPILN